MSNAERDAEIGDDEVVEVDGGGAIWPKKAEEYFITLMEEEVIKGNKQTTTFTKRAWKIIGEELEVKIGKEYSQLQLKNKFNFFRGRWRDFSNLIKESGIRYNSLTGQVTAAEEVWKRLYKVHKHARTFRKKGCPYYKKLCIIYGDAFTMRLGAHAHPSIKNPSISEEGNNEEGSNECNEPTEETHKAKKAKPVLSSESSHPTIREQIQSAMIEGNSKKKLELLEKQLISNASLIGGGGNNTSQPKQCEDVVVLLCVSALNTLEGIDGSSYTKAIKLIHDDPLWRTIFLAMPDNRKKDWTLSL